MNCFRFTIPEQNNKILKEERKESHKQMLLNIDPHLDIET